MKSSYYIKGQPPGSAKYEIHSAGIEFTLEDLIPDYPWLERSDVFAREKSLFLTACAAHVAAVEALRYGLIYKDQATHQIGKAKEVIREMEQKYGRVD